VGSLQVCVRVKAYRVREAKARSSLVVAIDADTGDLSRRSRQLRESLDAERLPARTERERIVHLVPKRNIETWILNLNGGQVDEETDFRRAPGIDDQIANAASTFFDWSRPNAAVPDHCVPSLRAAIPEIRRLEVEQ
jgi:hypothetical protein